MLKVSIRLSQNHLFNSCFSEHSDLGGWVSQTLGLFHHLSVFLHSRARVINLAMGPAFHILTISNKKRYTVSNPHLQHRTRVWLCINEIAVSPNILGQICQCSGISNNSLNGQEPSVQSSARIISARLQETILRNKLAGALKTFWQISNSSIWIIIRVGRKKYTR